MNRIYKYVVFLLLAACSVSESRKEQAVSIPFIEYSFAGIPRVEVRIDGKMVPMELDLGFQGEISGHTSLVSQLNEKELLGTKIFVGFKGVPYDKHLYRIPKIEIANICFNNPILQEHDEQFDIDSIVEPVEGASHDLGRLGWKLFQNSLLLIDAPSNSIIMADSWKALEKKYSQKDFIALPLFLEGGLIEFDLGNLRCILDSGCTWNILNCPKEEAYITLQTTIGPISFHKIPVDALEEGKAILGMDFIQERQIVIDFQKRVIYLKR
jgi:hypothetical protein